MVFVQPDTSSLFKSAVKIFFSNVPSRSPHSLGNKKETRSNLLKPAPVLLRIGGRRLPCSFREITTVAQIYLYKQCAVAV